MSTLANSLETLAATPVSKTKFYNAFRAYVRIQELEAQLGEQSSAPEMNIVRANTRIAVLESKLADKKTSLTSPAPVAAPVAAADLYGMANRAIKKEMDPLREAGILKATFAEWRSMDPASRAQFTADGGALPMSDFQAMTPKAKMDFMRSGGKILEAVQEDLAARAAAAQAQKPAATDPTNTKSRADFEKLPSAARMEWMRNGGQITD